MLLNNNNTALVGDKPEDNNVKIVFSVPSTINTHRWYNQDSSNTTKVIEDYDEPSKYILYNIYNIIYIYEYS